LPCSVGPHGTGYGGLVGWRAVIFDLDDTLILEEAVARASLRVAIGLVPGSEPNCAEDLVLGAARTAWRSGPHYELAVELGIASWEGLWSRFEGCHPRLLGLAEWAPTYRQQAWLSALAALGVNDPDLASAMAEAYEQAQRSGHPLKGGAAQAVRQAQQHFRLGLLTNGPADIQRLKVEQAGLAGCFDAVVVSGEVGVGKPSLEVFRLVLDALAVRPEEAVMVGDSWDRDIKGALAAGISAVWIAGERPVPDATLDVIAIPSVGALAHVLDRAAADRPPPVPPRRC
jgi:HAD superfamily hydrolase (TIGR01549 family)